METTWKLHNNYRNNMKNTEALFTSLDHVAWRCWKHNTFADTNTIGCANCGKHHNTWIDKAILLPITDFLRKYLRK